MTDRLTDHLDALGHGLVTAERIAERRRRRIVRGTAAGTVALAIGLGGLVGLPGGQRLDPVDRARAALDDSGGLLHWIVQTSSVGPNDPTTSEAPADAPSDEVWTATGGDGGFRVRSPADGRPRSCGYVGHLNGPRGDVAVSLVEPTEYASTATENTSYSPWSKTFVVVRAVGDGTRRSAVGPASTLVWGLRGDVLDPVLTIRSALERGQLRDGGTVERGGRTMRRLVGEGQPGRETTTMPSAVDPQTGERFRAPGRRKTVKLKPDQLTYLVDPETFTPIEMTTRRNVVWSRAGGYAHVEWVSEVARFSLFERLPDTPENRRLLEIRPPSGTRVIRLPAAAEQPAARLPRRAIEIDRGALQRCEAARRGQPAP